MDFYGFAIIHKFTVTNGKSMLRLGIGKGENACEKGNKKDPFFHTLKITNWCKNIRYLNIYLKFNYIITSN